MKIPCVTTSLANNALGAVNKENILIGNNAEELAARVVDLLKNEELCSKIAEGGHTFVQRNYDWTTFCNQLNQLMRQSSNHPIEA